MHTISKNFIDKASKKEFKEMKKLSIQKKILSLMASVPKIKNQGLENKPRNIA